MWVSSGRAQMGVLSMRCFRVRTWFLMPVLALLTCTLAASSATGNAWSAYRPRRVRPLISPGLPGEGIWRAVGPPVKGRPPLLVTRFRPDAANPSALAYVAWIDHTRTQLGLYAGRDQPPFASPPGPAQVPFGQRWRLLAAFNGGFKFGSRSGGGGGFVVDGHTYVSLQRGLGTLVGYRNGNVDVIGWHGRATAGANVAFARQNQQLLVSQGAPGSDLYNRVAHLQHVQPRPRPPTTAIRPQSPTAARPIPLPRQPRLLRRLPPPARYADHRSLPLMGGGPF